MKRFVVYTFLLGIIVALGGFLFVDYQVGKNLSRLQTDGIPALYGAPVKLTKSFRLSPNGLLAELRSRNYQEVAGRPEAPGQYSRDSNSTNIYTRETFDIDGTRRPAVKISVKFNPWEVSSADTGRPTDALLEPQFLRYLSEEQDRTRKRVPLAEIPEHLQKAFLAIEDERFYSHFGLDPIGILRAMFRNALAGAFVQGGSTITQQLAKNVFLTPERTAKRKILELLAAFSLERRLSKSEILELYLNEVYLGQDGSLAIHGVQDATRFFFGKELSEISLPEAAVLAGLVKAPSTYSPIRHPERTKKRRDIVLAKMQELGFVTAEQASTASAGPVALAENRPSSRRVPHFVLAVEQAMSQILRIEQVQHQPVKIITGLHSSMQRCAEDAVEKQLSEIEKAHPKLKRAEPLQAGLVAIEPYTGSVRAWVGSRNYTENQFDHVNKAKRQIGSLIKPFLYLAALDPQLNSYKTATSMSILPDVPRSIRLPTGKTWTPENYDHEYRGDVTLRYALENSLNLPAVYVTERIGPRALVGVLERFKLEGAPTVPSLALGAYEATLLDITAAYAALANDGEFVAPRLLLTVQDAHDGSLLGREPVSFWQAAQKGPVSVLVNILQGVLARGTATYARSAGFKRPAAGKTGTSNETRDSWFVGFTPSIAAGVWVGFDDQRKTGLTGAQGALRIWTDFMKCTEPFVPSLPFVLAPEVEIVKVNPDNYTRVTRECPGMPGVEEVFVRGTEPRLSCGQRPAPREEPRDIGPAAPEHEEKRSFWERLLG